MSRVREMVVTKLCGATVALVLGVCSGLGVCAGEGPLEFSASELDFGSVALRAGDTKEITIRNTGDREITISKINWNCDCVRGHLEQPTLKPGDSTQLVVTVRAIKPGPEKGHLFVYSDASEQQQTIIAVSLEGIPTTITATPGEIQFGSVVQGQSVKKSVTLTVPNVDSAEIKKLHFNEELFEASVRRACEDGEPAGLNIEVAVKKDAPLGEFYETLVAYTDCQKPEACVIPLTGRISRELSATPASLIFPEIPQQGAISRTVVVRSLTGKAFDVHSIKSDLPQVVVSVEKTNGHIAVITVTLKPTQDPRTPVRSGSLRIVTNHGSVPEVIVPVRVGPSHDK